MSTLFSAGETPLGTQSSGPKQSNGKHLRVFCWHINPLDFHYLAQQEPEVSNDDEDTMSFKYFLSHVSSMDKHEVDLHE